MVARAHLMMMKVQLHLNHLPLGNQALVAKKSEPWIVGLTGKNASGKGEAARLLKNRGYQYESLSDALRSEGKAQHLDESRDTLIQLGQKLRKQEGPGILANRVVQKLSQSLYVIDSIRNPAEIEILRNAGTFLLIGIDATPALRFERAQKRGRQENAKNLKEFLAIESRELSTSSTAQQLDRCLEMADSIVMNDGTLEELEIKIVRLLSEGNFPLS